MNAENHNQTAGNHLTPPDLVHLISSVVISGQDKNLKANGIVTLYNTSRSSSSIVIDEIEAEKLA